MWILAGGNVVNDLYDVETDRINQPTRPLVTGAVSPRTAWAAALLLFGIGIASAWQLGPAMFAVASLAAGLLVLYSAKLKRTLLWGNLTVSFLGGLAFLYGGMAVGKMRGAVVPAILAFLFHLGREILKDAEDRIGDGATRANTLAVRFGARRAFGLTTAVFGILILFTPLPFLFNMYSSSYLWTVLVGVDTVLAYVVWSMWKDGSSRNLARLSRILKADMLVGLLAIVLGRG
jgi:geranylgeranylglycerol-phosphate geranylgeranyltransferase